MVNVLFIYGHRRKATVANTSVQAATEMSFDPDFRRAVRDYLKRERQYVAEAARELTEAGPFRKTATDDVS